MIRGLSPPSKRKRFAGFRFDFALCRASIWVGRCLLIFALTTQLTISVERFRLPAGDIVRHTDRHFFVFCGANGDYITSRMQSPWKEELELIILFASSIFNFSSVFLRSFVIARCIFSVSLGDAPIRSLKCSLICWLICYTIFLIIIIPKTARLS